jgi:hypothetical protein
MQRILCSAQLGVAALECPLFEIASDKAANQLCARVSFEPPQMSAAALIQQC